MSLPLTRRIARAALLVAAGAAAGVGAAGSAVAAPALPATPNVGGLTALDGSNLASPVNDTTQVVNEAAGTGSLPLDGVPTAQTLPAASLPIG
ncbi:hypothetical protein DIZ27_03970 [Streptomyces sp. NWU339]|nr:hypothetical protein DIZ27_03970 [Streptomyces sp. NWU339]